MENERKFRLGEKVTNIQNKETGEITAFDDDPEVYGVKTNGGYRIWGELDMARTRPDEARRLRAKIPSRGIDGKPKEHDMEYTWDELNSENIGIKMGGHIYTALSGPECVMGQWYAPSFDETGTAWDMYFIKNGWGETEGYTLSSVERANLGG
jgi:hypothetical protein